MIDNAVAYYEHLREQGCTPSKAVAHVEQRFGVPRRVVLDRVNGKVADHEATMIALAAVKTHLTDPDADPDASAPLLADLYAAITGESLPEAPCECGQPWSSHGNYAHAADCPARGVLG